MRPPPKTPATEAGKADKACIPIPIVAEGAKCLECLKRELNAKVGTGSVAFIGLFVALCLAVEANGTRQRNETWRTDEGLWADAVVKSPRNGRAWMNLGVAQMAKAQYVEAEYSFERAHLYYPTYSLIEVNLGVLCGALKRDGEAEWHFKQAIKLAPEDPTSHTFYETWKRRL